MSYTLELRTGTDADGFEWGGGFMFGKWYWTLRSQDGSKMDSGFARSEQSAERQARRVIARSNNVTMQRKTVSL